jgi:hypothetical protein
MLECIEIRRHLQRLLSFSQPSCEASQTATKNAFPPHNAQDQAKWIRQASVATVHWLNDEENGWLKAWLALQVTGIAHSSHFLASGPDTWICWEASKDLTACVTSYYCW